MSTRMPAELVCDALSMAITRRKPGAGLLHHSDRGVQYACEQYQELLKQNDIACSMSRTGNCYDNAMMESFWSSLKREAIDGVRFRTIEQARARVFEYIEMFYNRKRRHSSLGYVSPKRFEASQN
jgi:putative transposase